MWPVVSMRPSGGVKPVESNPEMFMFGSHNPWDPLRRCSNPMDGHVEAVVGVAEYLLEIIHADQRLRDEARRDHRVVNQGEVLHAAGAAWK